jgi:hypothetical protein
MISKKNSLSRIKSNFSRKSSYTRISNSNLKTKKHCTITNPNYCQNKESGGHQDTILSVGKIKCAKKIKLSDPELLFYKKINKLDTTFLQNFIPKVYGICEFKGNNYIVIENLKYGFEKPLTIDIKFGFATSSSKIIKIHKYNIISQTIKSLKHLLLDKALSSSSKFGFRIEGANLDKPLTKRRLMSQNVYKVLYNFFSHDKDNKALNSFIIKLYELISDVSSNDDFNKFLFIGSSILFTYDAANPEKTRCKLIDFNNTIILDNPIEIEKNKKHATKTILVFNNLLKVLEQLKLKI